LDETVREEVESGLALLRRGLAHRCLSDYTYRNLYLFRDAHSYRYLPGELPCISGISYGGAEFLLPLFDMADVEIERLRSILGDRAGFFPIARQAVDRLKSGLFSCSTSRDDADYLYQAETLVSFDGPGLGAKRSSVNRLLQRHSIRVQRLTDEHVDAALAVLDGWCHDKGKQPPDADIIPCREALLGTSGLRRLDGYAYYADGRAAGFILAEELNPGAMAIRFAKGRVEFDGIYPYMFQDFCERGRGEIQWVNFEQDLGLANFRRSKMSFRPAELLSKFSVKPA